MHNLIISIYEKSVDIIAETSFNKEKNKDILFTMPALEAHSKNPEDIAYSIDYFYKQLNKKRIFFSDYKEAPNPKFLSLLKGTVDILTTKYDYKYSQMAYLSGFLPTINNFQKLKKLYEDFDIPPIKNSNLFYFEEEWKNIMNSCELYPNFLSLQSLHMRNIRSKKMLYFMGAARPHRVAMLSFLIETNYIKDCYYSCLSEKHVVLRMARGCTHDPTREPSWNFKSIINILENTREAIPKELSSKPGDNVTQHGLSTDDVFYFSDSYYSIIPETSYFKKYDKDSHDQWNFHLDYTFITEKTMRSIGALHPFILVSRPHSLKGLRELGYKTFHPYIDESYDDEEDDYMRFEKIKNSIKKLNSKTDSEWLRFQHDIYPIVKHNHDWLKSDKYRRLSYHPSSI